MRIYLLNPYFSENYSRSSRWAAKGRGGTLYYPIWLAYATGILENEGHNVRLIDAIAKNWTMEDTLKDVDKFKPEMIVSESNFQSLKNDINTLKELSESSDAISVLVGPPTSQYKNKILNQGIDFLAPFEYDFTLKGLSKSLENGEIGEDQPGITYINDEGKLVDNPNIISSSEDLNDIPFVSEVYKNHLNIKDYFLNHSLYPMVQIFTGRGCPNRCTFCSWPETLMGRQYRVRSVESILDEFIYIKKNLPEVKEIFIEDDTFTINKNRVQNFCKQIMDTDMNFTWSCQTKANLDYKSMVMMKEAGCRLLDVGYESGSEKILENIKKDISVEQLRKFTFNAKKAKLKILADFVVGFPGEDLDTINKTINLINEVKPDLLQVSVATPIPGTEFYDYCKSNEYLVTNDLEKSLDEDGFQKCIVSYNHLNSEEIEVHAFKILKNYYLSPRYISIALKNISGEHGYDEFKLMSKSFMSFFKYLKS
jgi:anaerobic magnesium-protoporphyrin IX monomethyl ester cyclase